MPDEGRNEPGIPSRTVEQKGDIPVEETARAAMRLLRVAAELLHRNGELTHVDPSWVDAHITLRGKSKPHGRGS